MTTNIDKVRDRIRLLLNVAKNDASSEGEINNALRFAQNLMKKHHLSEEDIPENDSDIRTQVDSGTKARVFVSVGGKVYAWENSLAAFCRDFVGGIGVYQDNNKRQARDHRGIAMRDPIWNEYYEGKSFCFFGLAEDAQIAAMMFHELRLTIAATARLKFGACYTGNGGVYAQGFVAGLFTKIKQQALIEKQEATPTGLIFIGRRDELIKYKEESAKAWLKKEFNAKLEKGGGYYGATGSHEAWREGKEDGTNSDVNAARRQKIGGTH